MGDIGDIYILTHKFRDPDNKLCSNVYFYRRAANAAAISGSYAAMLVEDWNTNVLTALLPTFPPLFVAYEVSATNLFDHAEQYQKAISRPGTRGVVTEYMPTFTNAVVTLSVDNGLVRKGRKAFTGLLEGDQSGGQLIITGVATMALRAAQCLVQLVAAAVAGQVFRPVVVKRIPIFDGSEIIGYELPGIVGEAIFGHIVSAVVSTIVSSQNSRKD